MEPTRIQDNTNTDSNPAFREARIARKIVASVVLFFVVAIASIAIVGYIYINNGLEPAAPDDQTVVNVTIPIGSSGSAIASILEEKGLINDAKIFQYYIKFKNESGFMAGDYKLSPSMEIQEIIEHLKTGTVKKEALFTVTIPEGKQLEEIAKIIDMKTTHTAEEFLKIADNKEYLKELIKRHPSVLSDDILKPGIRHPLEGYLFPSTYDFYEENPSIETIIEEMVKQTELILSAYKEKITGENFTVHELLTLASLIEEEATEESDRNKIASVFYNRMQANMPLQTDPTVLYALGKHSVTIILNDLKVKSPYNTYIVKGLPVGPISNAGNTSIEAALYPEETDKLYFYARPNGEVIFTSTLKEHNQVKNKYKQEWEEYKK